jgi:phage shock protein PspC (stress-responsive transcriptional regulator)
MLISGSSEAVGQTLALLVTFLGIGVIANVIVVYIIAQVMAERRQNRERSNGLNRGQY